MNQQDRTLVVVEANVPLADSREIALQLGIEHRSFFRMITDYQHEIEADFELVRFEIAVVKTAGSRGVKHSKYALLTEDQTYAYMSYSQNTEQARRCKRLLVKAFAEARQRLHVQQGQPQTAINSLWERRTHLFSERTCIPEGYWCIFHEIANVCWWLERQGVHLREDAVPDVSVGLLWMKEVRRLGLDEHAIGHYLHHYPDTRKAQHANIYPNAWLGLFRDWLQRRYLKEDFQVYIRSHARPLSYQEHKQLPSG